MINELENKTYECKFIRYPDNNSRYRFCHNEQGLIENRDAIYIEVVKQVNPLEKKYYY